MKRVFTQAMQESQREALGLLLPLAKGRCPDCFSNEWWSGPPSLILVQIECVNCGSQFELETAPDGLVERAKRIKVSSLSTERISTGEMDSG